MARVRASKAPLVFINAWATWCQPCIEEFPELVHFQKAHPPPDAELLFVTTDFGSEREKAETFFRSSGAQAPGYMKKGGDMEFIDGLSKRWSGALPATFLFDRQGNLLELWQGKVDFEKLEAALALHRKTQ
jgi:thiol-disulfide isomerase/thioredoxin